MGMTNLEMKEIEEKKPLLNLWSKIDKGNLKIDEKEKSRINLYRAYEKIIALNKDYMDLPDETHKVIAIWILSTHFHELFQTFPYLFLNAMKGSGKTRQLKIISNLANKGEGTIENSLTESVLFRWERNKVLCLDECENLGSKEKQALRQILNSAYKKGVRITRMKRVKTLNGEEKFEPEYHEPFMPVCMANISGMEEVLSDRSISVVLEKSNNPRITKKAEDFDDNDQINQINSIMTSFSVVSVVKLPIKNIYRWNKYLNNKYQNTPTNYTNIYTTHTTLNYTNYTTKEQKEEEEITEEEFEFFNKMDESGIDGRNFELCFPLLFVAKILSDDVFQEILNILKKIINFKKEDDFSGSRDISFYDFISNKDSWRFSWIKVKAITSEFKQYMGEQDVIDDRWLNDRWVGRALTRLKLNKEKKRMAQGMEVQIDIDKAKEKIKIFK